MGTINRKSGMMYSCALHGISKLRGADLSDKPARLFPAGAKIFAPTAGSMAETTA
jgi:hypothetical protein